jgi:thienamycin biosynthesis protein ThnN
MMNSCLHQLTDQYLKHILETGFHSESGALYWKNKEKDLHINAINQIKTFDDFKKYFAFKNREELVKYEKDLRELPIEDFIPVSTQKNSKWIWASETGGTTGIAKRGTWGNLYWKKILEFSDEFLDIHNVPRGENWLFVGPTGPHTTGRLLVSIAEKRGGKIFCIDMDPRIVRLYLKEGNDDMVNRYIRHIWEQVEPIVRFQHVGVMFCTASLLELMPQYVDIKLLDQVKAIVHAGLAMSKDTHRYLREEMFAHKPVVGIYGTSVSGISYQKPYEAEDNYSIVYIPCQPYIVLECIDENGELVGYGKKGDVRCFRFTEDQIIPGFIERDKGTRIKPYGKFASVYNWDWVADPHSPESLSGQKIEGVY